VDRGAVTGPATGGCLAEYAGGYQVDPTRLDLHGSGWRLYYHYTSAAFVAMTPSGPDSFTVGTRALHRFQRVEGQPVSVMAPAPGADYRGVRMDAKPPAKALLEADDLKGLVGSYKGGR
jgi:hypothetical protein